MSYEYYRNRKSLTLAIDFDGTIVSHAYPNIGEPIKNAKEVMDRLMERGHKIVIWTARNGKDLEKVRNWLIKNKYHFECINKNIINAPYRPWPKIYCDLFIEDRNVGGLLPWLIVEEIVMNIENGGNNELPRHYIQSLIS